MRGHSISTCVICTVLLDFYEHLVQPSVLSPCIRGFNSNRHTLQVANQEVRALWATLVPLRASARYVTLMRPR